MIYNLSISGDATKDIPEKFSDKAKFRNTDGTIFQSGTNNSLIINGKNFILPKEFKDNINKLIEQVKNITKNVAFFHPS